jgi:hypothetical protein
MRYGTASDAGDQWSASVEDPEAWRRIPPGTPIPASEAQEPQRPGGFVWYAFWIIGFIICPPAMIYMWIEDKLCGGYLPRNLPGPCYYADF